MLKRAIVAVALMGCGPMGSGDVDIFVEAEETITEGLSPGPENEDVVDGWAVTYQTFTVAIGDLHLHDATAGLREHAEAVRVVDLISVPENGFPLASFESIAAGTWGEVSFATPAASATAIRDESVSIADFDEMVAGGCTYLIAGTLINDAGETCVPGEACVPATSISFRLCIPADTTFDSCSTPDGLPGLVVNDGLTTSASVTIHGDHLFFSAFPSGEELVARRAQWLANCDTDHSGDVDRAELEAAGAAEIFVAPDYSLAGATSPIETAWDFVIAQVKTQGHWNGEGECLVDGEGHEH